MIIKIQRPIATNADPEQALIYNEDRSLQMHVPLGDVASLFGEGVFKIYHRAFYDPDARHLEIAERVRDQRW